MTLRATSGGATAATLALAAALSGCGGGGDHAAAGAPASAAPAVASSTPAAGSPMPASCEAYIKRVQACLAKPGADKDIVASYQQRLDASMAFWSTVADKATLAGTCVQLDKTFDEGAARLHCE